MAKTDTATETEKLVEVRLLRNYVPRDARPVYEDVYEKIPAGSVISLPRSEAKDVIAKGIAEITADLV